MTLSGFQGETDYFSRKPEETLEDASATTRPWERGRLSVEWQPDTILLLMLLLKKTNLRFPGEITKNFSTIETNKDPGRGLPVGLIGLGDDWLRGGGSQQVLLAVSCQTSSGRRDLTWCLQPGARRGRRLFCLIWQPAVTPGEEEPPGEEVQGEDQGGLRKITMRCWTRQKLS